jgi:hypothetical protein
LQQYFTISRHVSLHGGFLFHALRLFELRPRAVRLDHVASVIVNANRGIVAAGPRKFSISSPVDEMSR